MTRKASKQSQQSDKQLELVFGMDLNELIAATNNGLLVAEGHQIAVVDTKGDVVQRGTAVEKAIFRAVCTLVVKSFCSRFKGFSDADFK